MFKIWKILTVLFSLYALSACSANGQSNNVVYGDVKAGVETSRHF